MRKKVIKKINRQIYIICGLLFTAFIIYFIYTDIHKLYINFFLIPLNIFFMYLFNKIQNKFTFPALYDKKIYYNFLIKFIIIFSIMFILLFLILNLLNLYIFLFFIHLYLFIFLLNLNIIKYFIHTVKQ